MKLKPEIQALHAQMTEWRHEIHRHPETAFEEVLTSEFVAKKLTEFGIEIHRGLAKTGVVGILQAGSGKKNIALRADMDALDLRELNTFSHRSVNDGKMHACGHDGHTTMLLGAARYLAKTKNFDGTVYFIFQPAEENRAGAKVMINDGLFVKFPATAVYGLHNMPGYPAGKIAAKSGPIMASADFFEITITGVGAHGAYPHTGIDPIPIAAEIVLGLQRIVSRTIDPLEHAVVSVTMFNSGFTTNVIPETAKLAGTARAFLPEVQEKIERSVRKIATGIAEAHGAKVEIVYNSPYCATINSPAETERAALAAAQVVGSANVIRELKPVMGSEDFGWMLREKPGCYIWLGNGAGGQVGSCMIHNPHYDFNDEILPIGATYWATLVEQELPRE